MIYAGTSKRFVSVRETLVDEEFEIERGGTEDGGKVGDGGRGGRMVEGRWNEGRGGRMVGGRRK